MIKEKHIKEMLELYIQIQKKMKEYVIFREEHPDEICSEKEEDIAKAIYSIADKASQVAKDFPEIFNNHEDTSCIEE